jgi:small subunit ribosomal protein S6
MLDFIVRTEYNTFLAHPCAARVAVPLVREEVESVNRYELVYILDAALEDEARKEQISRFGGLITNNGGTVEKMDEWGKRRLAYPINFKNEGYYVMVSFTAAPEVPREMERNLQIADSVLRYQIIKLELKRSNVKPRAVRTIPPAAPAVVEPAPVAAPVKAADAE